MEHVVKDITSFPVGRIQQLVLHPFDFEEFLWAKGKENIVGLLEEVPVREHYHEIIRNLFHEYVVIGAFGNSNYKSREVGEALLSLDKSRLIQLVYPTISLQPPQDIDFTRKPRLQFWVREKVKSSSEVDIIYPHEQYLIPVEVKSGAQGRLRSLHQIIDRTNHSYAVRLLSNKLSIEKVTTPEGKPFTLLNMPYYLATRIPQYVRWLVN